MTLNEALMKQNFIIKVLLKDGNEELSKALKVKIMKIRIALGKFRKQFDEDIQEAIKGLKPDNFDDLAQKQDKTPEEEEMFKAMSEKINEEYNLFLIEKGKDEVIFNEMFTEEEYEEILEINAGNDVEINGNKLQAADFLEIIHGLFVA